MALGFGGTGSKPWKLNWRRVSAGVYTAETPFGTLTIKHERDRVDYIDEGTSRFRTRKVPQWGIYLPGNDYYELGAETESLAAAKMHVDHFVEVRTRTGRWP